MARIVGWCAHRNEELNFEGKRIIRPAYKNVLEEEQYGTVKETVKEKLEVRSSPQIYRLHRPAPALIDCLSVLCLYRLPICGGTDFCDTLALFS